jgi:NADH pyrophosphatase NudC (nudix superfamily)
MIGCIAKAKSDELHVDDSEMEEVRWVSRADISKALERSSGKDNPLVGEAPPLRLGKPISKA